MFKLIKIHEKKIVGGIVLFLFALNFVIWLEVFEASKKPEIAVYFFDVGQGDAIFIESRDGTQILIDGGPPNRILPHLAKAMPYFDNHIDVVVSSHPHLDHVSGLLEVLKKYSVGMVIESGVNYHTAEAQEFRKLVESKIEKSKRIMISKPMTIGFFEGARLRFVHPLISYENKTLKDVHDAMVVAELEYAGKKILFPGDAGIDIEEELVRKGFLEDIDVLKVGHQGSKNSSSARFLKTVKPEQAIISVGKNRYGHPHPDAISRLASVGAKIFRTDRDGTVVLEIRNGELLWKTAED